MRGVLFYSYHRLEMPLVMCAVFGWEKSETREMSHQTKSEVFLQQKPLKVAAWVG